MKLLINPANISDHPVLICFIEYILNFTKNRKLVDKWKGENIEGTIEVMK